MKITKATRDSFFITFFTREHGKAYTEDLQKHPYTIFKCTTLEELVYILRQFDDLNIYFYKDNASNFKDKEKKIPYVDDILEVLDYYPIYLYVLNARNFYAQFNIFDIDPVLKYAIDNYGENCSNTTIFNVSDLMKGVHLNF